MGWEVQMSKKDTADQLARACSPSAHGQMGGPCSGMEKGAQDTDCSHSLSYLAYIYPWIRTWREHQSMFSGSLFFLVSLFVVSPKIGVLLCAISLLDTEKGRVSFL